MFLAVPAVVKDKTLKMVLVMAKHVEYVIVGVPIGRCISLLKILMTNSCIYDCKYCMNRSTNAVARATLAPREIADLTINFYKRNYIEGLFLSSGVIRSPDYTMEQIYKAVLILRKEYNFNGYIHTKSIPGSSPEIINKLGRLVDRMSINIELPSANSLKLLAPEKEKHSILEPMEYVSTNILESSLERSRYKEKFVPARSNYTINCWCYS